MIAANHTRACRFVITLFVFFILSATGTHTRADDGGFLGMQVQGNSPKIAAALGLKTAIGVLVRDITVYGPASNAGISRGDLIVKMHGTDIDTFERMIKVAGSLKAGDKVKVDVLRQKKKKTFEMVLTPWPDGWRIENESYAALPELGLTFAAITPKVRDRLNLRWGSIGVVVTVSGELSGTVTPLYRGDVVTQINQKQVWDPQQFLNAYSAARKEGRPTLLLLVERKDGFKYVLQPVLDDPSKAVAPPNFQIPGQDG